VTVRWRRRTLVIHEARICSRKEGCGTFRGLRRLRGAGAHDTKMAVELRCQPANGRKQSCRCGS
jgi:hypothetical protein